MVCRHLSMPGSESQFGSASCSPERRHYARLRCALPVDVRPLHSSFPLQAETTDLSLGGCYVATMFPLPIGTEVEFRFWIEETRVGCRAVIRTCDPGVGNGIQFSDLDELSRERLQAYLASLQGREENFLNQPTGAIHPHL
jgi:c-di-GMP-binding flagellar brake protein YcgR